MQTVRRLYETFQPKSYQIEYDLTEATTKKTYNGRVVIKGHQSNADNLRLHAKDLSIDSIKVDGQTVDSQTAENDELVISSPNSGDIAIEIDFRGQLTDAMHGIYPCYFKVDGKPDQLIATQFESHHAREAFPCVDEPEAKATFDVTLKTKPNLTALSNMPIKDNQSSKNSQVISFETTPRMSTYLLAFVVGDLHQISGETKNGVAVNIFSTKAHAANSMEFALNTAIKSIEFFEDYFDINYPLPKSDHVALPDFSSGAMENWGLITYRENCLLVDEYSATSSKEQVATVIAHEVSHQWFGNLVTMRWWDDLWLNESFANLMEYIAIDNIYPEFKIWNTYATQETISALRRDRLAGVQSVKTGVNHPDEISTLFDPSIVYAKGGRLLKMLRAYLGEEAWRSGLKNYFEVNQYKNTSGDDLWQSLSASSGKDVAEFMNAWLNQSGYPVVNLETNDEGFSLSQKRFVIGEEADSRTWPIPLAAESNAFPEIMSGQALEIASQSVLPLLNKGNAGHFITNYDDIAINQLIEGIKNSQLSTIDRLALLHEQSLLAYTPLLDTGKIVDLLSAYQSETEEPVWDIIAMVISELKRFVEDDTEAEDNLKQLITRLALPIYDQLGPDQKTDDSEEDTKLRATIVSLLSYAEYQPLINHYLQTFRSESNLAHLPGETRTIVFGVAAKYGEPSDFTRLLECHKTTPNPELRDDLVGGVTATRNDQHIQQLLSQLTDTSVIKPQDLARWYIMLLRNRYARKSTWRWLIDNWGWIETIFKGDKSYDSLVRYSSMVLAGDKWLEEFTKFFEPKMSDTALRRNIEVGIVDITARTDWIKQDQASVKAALDRQTH